MGLTAKELPQHARMVNNILSTYFDASEDEVREGMSWYNHAWDACEYIAAIHDRYSPLQIAGVMSVLSPGMVWDENESAPARAADLHSRNIRAEGWAGFSTYPANLKKAQSILDGDFDAIRGRKVTNFFGNISGATDVVTVDRWAIRVALNDPYLTGDKIVPSSQKSYNLIADAYKAAAELAGINACDMQAVVWCVYRNKYYGKIRTKKEVRIERSEQKEKSATTA